MTPDQIEKLAREAGMQFGATHITPDGEERWASVTDRHLARFAQIVRASALEEAARVCEAHACSLDDLDVMAEKLRALAQQAGGEGS